MRISRGQPSSLVYSWGEATENKFEARALERGVVIKRRQLTLIRKETMLIFAHFWCWWESRSLSI